MTLRLSDGDAEALRRRAEREQRSMQDVVRAAIREYVEGHSRAELLDEVLRRTGGLTSVPAATPSDLNDDEPLDLPLMEDFRVGAIALAWDGEDERVVIEAQEESETPVEPLAEDIPENGPGVLRVRITAASARAFSQRALRILGQGRPPCPLCGLPLDTEGHICPRQNGHRAANG